MSSRARAIGPIVVAAALLASAVSVPAAQAATPVPNERQTAWVNDNVVRLWVKTPRGPADGPKPNIPDVQTLLIGGIDGEHPQDNGGTFPLPPGMKTPDGKTEITVPVHDLVIPKAIKGSSGGADCFGNYVLRGPKGNRSNVLVRRDANGSGLLLAYAIRQGGVVKPLDDAATIHGGVKAGLLKLDPSIGYGGVCWTGQKLGTTMTPPKFHKWSVERTFKEVTTQFYFSNTPPEFPKVSGPRGAGNLLFSSGDLFERGRKVGDNTGFCLTVNDARTRINKSEGPGMGTPVNTPNSIQESVAHCEYTFGFGDGTVSVQGRFNQTEFEGSCFIQKVRFCTGSTETLAVVGGTGRYAGADGEVLFKQIEYPDVIRLTLRLR